MPFSLSQQHSQYEDAQMHSQHDLFKVHVSFSYLLPAVYIPLAAPPVPPSSVTGSKARSIAGHGTGTESQLRSPAAIRWMLVVSI